MLSFSSLELFSQNNSSEISNIEFMSDSLIQLRRTEFLTPIFIFNVIGMPMASKKNLESDLNLMLYTHRGGKDYYEINGIPVGMLFMGKTQVCVELSFRLFGEDGTNYLQSLIKQGFSLRKTSRTANLELEGDLSSNALYGTLSIYRKGDVICEVYDGTFIGFTFYRTK